MPTVQELGATPGVRQRLDEEIRVYRKLPPERWPPVRVDLRVLPRGRAVEQGVDVGAELPDLGWIDHPLEHVAAMSPVRLQDVRMQRAARVEADGAAVVQLRGTPRTLVRVISQVRRVLGGGRVPLLWGCCA